MNVPRLVLAGLSGGSGKTIASLALCRAWSAAGRRIKPFKKGPDYIDAAWLGLAAGEPTTNLDPHMLGPEVQAALFAEKAQGFDAAVIEGNRGLFDGKDLMGTCSTAELARLLRCPVVLVLNCTKMTRTAAAVILGCRGFEPGLELSGVILNQVANDRHRSMLVKSIEAHTEVRVLGVMPRLAENPIPERHMGLVSDQEFEGRERSLEDLGRAAGQWLDLDGLLAVAAAAPEFSDPGPVPWPGPIPGPAPVIGYVHDAALWFYYPENLEALERAGARLVRLSLLDPAPWPEIHGLYLGGGFPETQARALSENLAVKNTVLGLVGAGLPVYAECGGFMYLCAGLEIEGREYPMAGVFPLSTRFCPRPQGLGYTEAEVVLDNPFLDLGTRVRGHEFHYSVCSARGSQTGDFCLRMTRGQGMLFGLDGILRRNAYAAYTHIHALGAPCWAPNFAAAAKRFMDSRPSPAGQRVNAQPRKQRQKHV
ncbi:MAG: cobyrinate a,c-diamide synthase [Desulfovibrionaceae bacterium]|nr:cobyrinate a,c-diamide synthase [Desulfovibrionaceae bacterium]